jgi:hypothetical protein
MLSNTSLRAASQTEAYGSPQRAGAAAALGGFLLLIGLGLVAVTLVAPGLLAQQALAVYCVVPLMFGLDLIWTALARSRSHVVA